MVRDYTFLLDPPGAHRDAGQSSPSRRSAPEVGTSRRRARRRRTADAGAGRRGAPPRADTPAAAIRSSAATRCPRSPARYKPENVSLEQMLVALFRSNEIAFDGKNMNRLRSGQIITVPQADR